jgi:hypothetical protein
MRRAVAARRLAAVGALPLLEVTLEAHGALRGGGSGGNIALATVATLRQGRVVDACRCGRRRP